MRTHGTGIEHMLQELGQARATGLLGRAGSSLPWQAEACPAAEAARVVSVRWPRIAAVAACVAVTLVGLWQLEQSPTQVADSAKPAVEIAKAPPAIQSQKTLIGDYNGDGVVDGDDIPYFVRVQAQNKQVGSDSKVASELTRLLLGS